MKLLTLTFLFLTLSFPNFGQNYTKDQTIKYINEKMKIADPVFSNFELGENGEALIKWVNFNFYTEYRFNIREIEFKIDVNSEGDNTITLTCNQGLNNCLQLASREMVNLAGNKVSFKGDKYLDVASIAGFDNVTSIKNALLYFKVLSLTDNANKTSAKIDPFLN